MVSQLHGQDQDQGCSIAHLRYDWWRDQGYFRPNSDTCKNSGNIGGIGKKRLAVHMIKIIVINTIINLIIIIIIMRIIIHNTHYDAGNIWQGWKEKVDDKCSSLTSS